MPTTRSFIVEIEDKCWLAPWSGDPGRTVVEQNAQRFATEHAALMAMVEARTFRPFPSARIVTDATPPNTDEKTVDPNEVAKNWVQQCT